MSDRCSIAQQPTIKRLTIEGFAVGGRDDDILALTDQIARWRENVIDFEIVVDDSRRALAAAVRDRDRAVMHLSRLVRDVLSRVGA